VALNNGVFSARWNGTAIAPNTWYRIAVQLDVPAGQALLSINGSSVRPLALPPSFAMQALELPRSVQDDQKRFVFSNDRTARAFSGKLRALQVFPAGQADLLPLRSRLSTDPAAVQEFAFPPISTKSVGLGRFDLAPTSAFGLTTSTRSLTPGVCAASGTVVTLLGAGLCVLGATQADVAAGFTTACSTVNPCLPISSCPTTTCNSTPNRTAETRTSFAVTGDAGAAPPPQTSFVLGNGTIPGSDFRVFASGSNASLTLSARLTITNAQWSQAVASGLKVFVFAYIPATGALTAPVLLVKNPAGDWGPLGLPLTAYLENVAANSADRTVLIEIIAGNDFSNLVGTEFYIGYGTSDAEMVQSRRYRGIYKVSAP
jgi:hypothetical protein